MLNLTHRHLTQRHASRVLTGCLAAGLLAGCGLLDRAASPRTTAAAPTPTAQSPSMPPVETSSTGPVADPSLQAVPSLDGVTPTPEESMKPTLRSGYSYVKDYRTGLTFAIRTGVQVANPTTIAKTGKAPSNWRQLASGQNLSIKNFAKKAPQRFGLGRAHYISSREYWMLSYATMKRPGAFRVNSLAKSQVERTWKPAAGKGTLGGVAIVDTPMGQALVVSRKMAVEKPIGLKFSEERTLILPYGDNVAMISVSDSSKDGVNKPMQAIIESIHQK